MTPYRYEVTFFDRFDLEEKTEKGILVENSYVDAAKQLEKWFGAQINTLTLTQLDDFDELYELVIGKEPIHSENLF